jgi:polyisoprenoid-binding protein YceI
MTNDKPTGIAGLNFNIPVESLKSGKSAMDKNTFKALKSDVHKSITFQFVSGTVSQTDAVTYQVKTIGKMTIAGTTRQMDLWATAKYNPADKSFTVTGTEKMKMTDFNVTPPTVMFGTIKTGNDISISFSSKFIK